MLARVVGLEKPPIGFWSMSTAVTKRGTIKKSGDDFKARLYGRSHGGGLNYSAPHFSFSRKGVSFSCVLSLSFSHIFSLVLCLSRLDAVKSDTMLHKRFNT